MNTQPRIRRDPREMAAGRSRQVARPTQSAADEAGCIRVENPACHVLAVLDMPAGRLSRADREIMGAARQLADLLDGAVVLFGGHGPDVAVRAHLEAEGADRAAIVIDPIFADGLAEPRVPFVIAAAETCTAPHILFPETPIGGELARRVAARLGERPATRLRRVSATEAAVAADAGRLDVVRPLPRILVPEPDAFAPLVEPSLREARPIQVTCRPQPARARIAEILPIDPAGLPLTEAELILGAGAGVTDWTAFHSAAAALGAAEGGSRVVCDAGLLPRSRQVGASGVLVAPRCYLAFGIAGASQHLQGIAEAERVVAVNADPRAEMMKRADLAIVADAQTVLPALVRRARERGAARHHG